MARKFAKSAELDGSAGTVLPPLDHTRVMGVLNVTPDSFSDGQPEGTGRDAIRHGLRMWHEGADVIDVGGESTRPGANRVPIEEELRRAIPVVSELAAAGVRVSIDTTRRRVAESAVMAGACLVNDVSGGRADRTLPRFVAEAGLPYVVMHWRGHSAHMNDRAHYKDVVQEVVDEIRSSIDGVVAVGVQPGQIIVDPGLGFAKTSQHNWELLAHLDELDALGRPLLIGASRKSFLGGCPVGPRRLRRAVSDRDGLTAALTAILAKAGVWAVRVHDVRRSVEAIQVVAAVSAAATARDARSEGNRSEPVNDWGRRLAGTGDADIETRTAQS